MILAKLFFLISAAFANGHVVTNGGNLVRCPDTASKSEIFQKDLAFFDLFEYQGSRHYTYKKLASYRGQSLEVAFPKAIKYFFARSPFYQGLMLEHFNNFSREVKIVDRDLPQVMVTSWYVWMKGCQVVQAALQYTPMIPTMNPTLDIKISSRFWTGPERLGTDQKIALLIHEYLYGSHLVSGNLCAFHRIYETVGTLLSDQQASLTEHEWNSFLNFDCEAIQ